MTQNVTEISFTVEQIENSNRYKMTFSGDETAVVVTEHALKRLKERAGISKKASFRIIDKALHLGISWTELKGYKGQWARAKCSSEENEGIRYIVYGELLFIFTEENTLITVEQIPGRTRVLRMKQGYRTCSKTDCERRERLTSRVSKKTTIPAARAMRHNEAFTFTMAAENFTAM